MADQESRDRFEALLRSELESHPLWPEAKEFVTLVVRWHVDTLNLTYPPMSGLSKSSLKKAAELVFSIQSGTPVSEVYQKVDAVELSESGNLSYTLKYRVKYLTGTYCVDSGELKEN